MHRVTPDLVQHTSACTTLFLNDEPRVLAVCIQHHSYMINPETPSSMYTTSFLNDEPSPSSVYTTSFLNDEPRVLAVYLQHHS